MRDEDVTRLQSARAYVSAAEAALSEVRESGGEAVPHGARRYPLALRALPGSAAPPLLCVRGAVSLLDQAGAGIVGGRQPEAEAEAMARACAVELVRLGAVIISGGARGIDTCAHEAAVAAGGCTIVVLPQGLLTYRPTPALETGLAAGRVLLLSEFAPRAPWSTPAAVTRNATISALSAMLCLFAPRRQGGSVATARWSLASGKPVGYAFADCAKPLLDAAHSAFPLLLPSGGLHAAALAAAWSTARHPAPVPDRLF
jgi:DNA processing protein